MRPSRFLSRNLVRSATVAAMTRALFSSAQRRLTQSERRFAQILDSLNDAVLLIGADGRIEYANVRMTLLLDAASKLQISDAHEDASSELPDGMHADDVPRETLIGIPAESITVLAGSDELPLSLTQWIERMAEKTLAEREAQLSCRDGTRRWFAVSASPVACGSGGQDSTLVTFTDISERKQIEAQLLHSQKMEAVGRLAGGVAHDFNNLLTAVLGYSGLLLNRLPPDNPSRREIQQIRKASEQAARLVEQLLTFSRKQVMIPRLLNLNRVVGETGRLLQRLIGEDIHLSVELDDVPGSVRAVRSQLQQIVLNLAINARDAMPDGGDLRIKTESFSIAGYSGEFAGAPAGSYFLLSVTDTGTGMSKDVLGHIFEPFFTTKEQGKGTGLGLSTVYGAVRQSGGFISVRSELGRGSSFRIIFPLLGDSPDEDASATSEQLSIGTETVLLVEDEPSVRVLLREVLERAGYIVLEAGDGEEAVRLAGRHLGPIDLMVTDVVMPNKGGEEAAREILTSRPDMKLLVISGYLHDSACAAFAERGSFLAKPFAPREFAETVREVLDGGAEPLLPPRNRYLAQSAFRNSSSSSI